MKIPYNFTPRPYQRTLFEEMEKGKKRFITVWHRRSGKDKTWMNVMVEQMLKRVGVYFYLLPTYAQGRKIVWEGIDGEGFKMIDHIPVSLRKRMDNQEMMIELVNGSIFRVVGTDKIDRVVGTNPVGCVFSEFSLQDPKAWDYISPILRENGGWAGFNFTPRGKNHAYHLLKYAQENRESWFTSVKSARDTKAIKVKDLDEERRMVVAKYGDDAVFRQEFMVEFVGIAQGAYYQGALDNAVKEGRVTQVEYDDDYPVHTAWDIGLHDITSIWFYQVVDGKYYIIDYLEDNNKSFKEYVQVIKQKPYVYGTHHFPHDMAQREFSSNESRFKIMKRLLPNIKILKRSAVADGIEASREMLARCYIDETKCARGLDCLYEYKREWSDKNQTYKDKPVHNWASHGADAFRYMSIAVINHNIKHNPVYRKTQSRLEKSLKNNSLNRLIRNSGL